MHPRGAGKSKIRMIRKTLLVALMASLQWKAIAFIQYSTLSFVPARVLQQQQQQYADVFRGGNSMIGTNLVSFSLVSPSVKALYMAAPPRSPRLAESENSSSTACEPASFFSLPRGLENPFSSLRSSTSSIASDSSSLDRKNNNVNHHNVNDVKTKAVVPNSKKAPPSATTLLPPGLAGIQQMVQPLQDALDDASADWILSYADLRPDSSQTWAGQSFLATNVLYMITGLILSSQGDLFFGTLTELCSVASYLYHYTQLEAAGETRAPTVRLAVLLDYILALASLGTASIYFGSMLFFGDASGVVLSDALTIDILVSTALALSCLGLSWVYESGRLYMFFHSLWHIFGAYAGLLIGSAHNHQPPVYIFSMVGSLVSSLF